MGKPPYRRQLWAICGYKRPQWSERRFQFGPARSRGLGVRGSLADPDSNTDPDSESNPHIHANPNSASSNSNTYAYTSPNPDSYSYADSDPDSHTNTHSDTYANSSDCLTL